MGATVRKAMIFARDKSETRTGLRAAEFIPARKWNLFACGSSEGRLPFDEVDDLRETNPPSNPELLEYLTKEFIAHKFDTKHLIRTIEEIYLVSLGRNPTTTEINRNLAHIQQSKDPKKGLEDVTWAILNSKEFMFNR